jgi:hypothetical protein
MFPTRHACDSQAAGGCWQLQKWLCRSARRRVVSLNCKPSATVAPTTKAPRNPTGSFRSFLVLGTTCCGACLGRSASYWSTTFICPKRGSFPQPCCIRAESWAVVLPQQLAYPPTFSLKKGSSPSIHHHIFWLQFCPCLSNSASSLPKCVQLFSTPS